MSTSTLGLFDKAVACYRRAIELQPDSASFHGNLGSVLKDIGEPLEGLKTFAGHWKSTQSALPLAAISFLSATRWTISRKPCFWRRQRFLAKLLLAKPPGNQLEKRPIPDRRLRIGFVSGDLCFHPVGFFIEGVLRALAARAAGNLDFFAYMNFFRMDPVSERIKSVCHRWREVFGLSDEEAAGLIQKDEIDILIDLSGHTGKNRLPLFAWKPAPIQVSWLGYFDTTGVEAIDYLIADPLTLPESEEIYFTETIWRLPDTRLCFTPPDTNVTIRPLPALTAQQITFGCFNSLNKMGDAVVALWARSTCRRAEQPAVSQGQATLPTPGA